MPSSKKTPNLFLNNWLGSDKPKKDDFNEDNQILDQSIGALGARVNGVEETAARLVEEAQGGWAGELAEAAGVWEGKLSSASQSWGTRLEDTATEWGGKLDAAKTDLNSQIQTAQGSQTAHAASAVMHITSAERTGWGNAAPIVGTYTGNGAAGNRAITLGYAPRAGIVFAAGMPIAMVMFTSSQQTHQYTSYFSSGGSAGGATATSTGFTVISAAAGSDGVAYKLNENGFPYVYIVWK